MTPGGRASVERFAVGGWVDAPATVLASRLLLLGELDGPDLLYVGFVRLGSRDEAASRLGRGLEGLEIDDCPFAHPPEVTGAHWCRDGLAVPVRYDGHNAIGRLRMPSIEPSRSRTTTSRIDPTAQPVRSRTARP